MPTFVWLLLWAVAIGAIAFLAIREIRSGRKQPPEFDRTQHEAVRESEANRAAHGPNNVGFWG